MKHPVRYRLEAALFWLLSGLLRGLPLAVASGFGGWVGQALGPLTAVNRRAVENLERAMPELDKGDIDQICRDMWRNLGRTAAEFFHMKKFHLIDDATTSGALYGPGAIPGAIELQGEVHLRAALAKGKPIMFFSAHLANWEILSLAGRLLDLPIQSVYRAANNPIVNAMIQRQRGGANFAGLPKGRDGARGILKILRSGGHVAMLVDQKLNDGIAVLFFGRPAMTAPALAQLAHRFDATILPVRLERLRGPRFRLRIEAPLPIDCTASRQAEVPRVMAEVNEILERWIKERPAEWLWLHQRWPKD